MVHTHTLWITNFEITIRKLNYYLNPTINSMRVCFELTESLFLVKQMHIKTQNNKLNNIEMKREERKRNTKIKEREIPNSIIIIIIINL